MSRYPHYKNFLPYIQWKSTLHQLKTIAPCPGATDPGRKSVFVTSPLYISKGPSQASPEPFLLHSKQPDKQPYETRSVMFCELALAPPSNCTFPRCCQLIFCTRADVASALSSRFISEIREHGPVSLIRYPDVKANAREACPYAFRWNEIVHLPFHSVFPSVRQIRSEFIFWQFPT